MADHALAPGTPIALVADDGSVQLLRVPDEGEVAKLTGVGVVAAGLFQEAGLGGVLELGRKRFRLLPLTPELVFEGLERRAQVIGAQDAARIAHGCGVGPGSIVVEGGLGTGAMTTYLAALVGNDGHVHGHDVREDHLRVAERNLRAAGLADRASLHLADLAKADIRCGAFIVDVPDPGLVVPAAERCLVPGGVACFYTPLVSQVEAVHRALRDARFDRVRTLEQLERDWVVHEQGARPAFQMMGHSGFLTFATRVLDEPDPPRPA